MTPTPPSLSVALKEWAVVCAALADGRQMILLRKGGIYESAGEFELEHRRFALFPTYLHQNRDMLKPAEHAAVAPAAAEPAMVRIAAAAEVTDIIPVTSRPAMDSLDDRHLWAAPLIDMRFNYKPKNPLYLILVRVWRLAAPVALQNTLAFAGCKSWVPLEEPIQTAGAVAVMDDARYQSQRRVILDRLKSHAG